MRYVALVALGFFVSIIGCNSQQRINEESDTDQMTIKTGEKDESLFNLMVSKKGSHENLTDSIYKLFDFSKRFSVNGESVLNLDSTYMDLNEYYRLSDEEFTSSASDSIKFRIYYKHSYGDELRKVLRVTLIDSVFDITLAMRGGDGQVTYTLDTEFVNDSTLIESSVLRETVVDDTYMMGDRIDSVVRVLNFNESLELEFVKVDSFRIRNTALENFPFTVESNGDVSHSDSLSVLLLWRRAVSENFDHSIANLTNEDLVRNMSEMLEGYDESKVYIAPDGSFKIHMLQGEGCGAYCSPIWQSDLKPTNGRLITNTDFKGIDTSFIMSDGKHLILESYSYRVSGNVFGSAVTVSLMSLENGIVDFIPIEYLFPKCNSEEKEPNKEIRLVFNQHEGFEEPVSVEYDPESEHITYSYIEDNLFCRDADSAFQYKGEFQYIDGNFKHLSETKEYRAME